MFEKFIEVIVALTAAINNLAEAYRGAAPAKPANETPSGEAPAEKKARKSKTEQAPAAESSPAVPAATPGASATQAPAVTHPDVKEVVAAAQAFLTEVENQDGGLFQRLAKQYGVERISQVAAEKRADLIATLKGELEKAKAAKAQPAI